MGTSILVETHELNGQPGHVKTSEKACDRVVVYARRPYGSVAVTVTATHVRVESRDGDGGTLEIQNLKIDDLVCDGEADGPDLDSAVAALDAAKGTIKEAGIGPVPNPLYHGEESRPTPPGQGGGEEGEESQGAD